MEVSDDRAPRPYGSRDEAARFLAAHHTSYIAAVVHLARHYRRPPELLTDEEVQA